MAKKSEQESQLNKKIRYYKYKDILTTVWVMLYIAIVVLEVLALFNVISFVYGLIVFIIATALKFYLTKKF